MTEPVTTVGYARCICMGTVLHRKPASWLPKDRYPEHAYCRDCGLIYSPHVITKLSYYCPIKPE